MAKFYTRYLNVAAVPSTPSSTVFYGYRGANYTVNGQFYTASTNVKQTDNFQTNSQPAWVECCTLMAPLTVDSVFEPGLMANAFDLLGSKLPNEYQAGIFASYGTCCTSRGEWSFKNMTTFAPISYCVQTESVTPCREGCVLEGSSNSTTGTMGICSYNCCNYYYACGNNYYRIEKPAGTINCFQPWSIGVANFCTNTGCTFPNCCCFSEKTFGNTVAGFYSHGPFCCYSNCGWNCSWQPAAGYFGSCICVPSVKNLEGFNYPSCYCGSRADQHLFGTTCHYFRGGGTNCYSNHIIGAQAYYGNCMGGSNEAGVRVFLTRNSAHTFYMFHDALQGGIQGVDISTDTAARLTLRDYNHGTNTTTVMATFKKGISGLVIPSQPDIDTTSQYRFYMMSFNGADTATQTVSIYHPDLNLDTGAATIGSEYTLTMTAGEQADLYADLGHNNTAASVYDSADFRRTTTNRIWYSTDSNSVKRLHLGIYNTNATGFVTAANGFNDPANRGKMFKIYSWSLDDANTSATYLGKVDLSSYAPKYFFPLDTNWRIVYSGASFTNDIILSLNQTTGLYQYQNTMPYIAPRLFKDREGRWAIQMVDTSVTPVNGVYSNYIDILTSDVGQTLVITADATSFTFTGTTINSNVTVNVYDYLGNRIAKDVTLSIVGATATPGVTFSGGAYSTTVTTSNSADTVVPVQIISSTSAKVIGTVTENL